MKCKTCGKEDYPAVSGECTQCLFKKLAQKLTRR